MKIINSLGDLDIIDVNYSTSYFRNSTDTCTFNRRIRYIIINLLFIIKQVYYDIISLFNCKRIKNKNVFFFNTVNQYNSLLPIYEIIQGSIFVTLSNSKYKQLPITLGYFFSLLLLPRFHFLINYKYKNNKKKILNHYFDYFFIEGMYIWWSIYLKINKPKRIVLSNDHSPWHRILLKAARVNNIPTIYIQHASVTEKFPKLEFDLSLLEGKDALNKYSSKELKGKIELVGMPKYDKYFTLINKQTIIKSIGICTSLNDSEEKIEMLCKSLKSSFNDASIFIRNHPIDTRYQFYQIMKEKYHLQFSNSNKENSFEYFRKIDVNIAGESSIHLEAVLMNVYPIYYNLKDMKYDHYGYIKNQLITDIFDNISDLISFIRTIQFNKPNIRFRAKYYVDTVNSDYDGKSAELAKSKILNFFSKK
ncbi:MAG: hypothetical protein WCY37_03705 [Candidatus Dojkabacteria bacterium]